MVDIQAQLRRRESNPEVCDGQRNAAGPIVGEQLETEAGHGASWTSPPSSRQSLCPRLNAPEFCHHRRHVLNFVQHRHFGIAHGEGVSTVPVALTRVVSLPSTTTRSPSLTNVSGSNHWFSKRLSTLEELRALLSTAPTPRRWQVGGESLSVNDGRQVHDEHRFRMTLACSPRSTRRSEPHDTGSF